VANQRSQEKAMTEKPTRALPYVGIISNSTKDIGDIANKYLPLYSKNVLCIGLSEEEIDQHVACYGPSQITSLTLWENHIDAQTTRFTLVIGDITKRTSFDDDQFDAIITLSLLEHVDPLSDALMEMRRICKRGGIIASIFGPVWSCAYGHHLYAINPADPLLNFSLWNMPAFMHLLWSKAEIEAFYVENGYSLSDVKTVYEFMFQWPGINRLMYDDYTAAFSELFQIEYVENMLNDINKSIIDELREKFKNNRDFHSYGAKIVLRNTLK
jgi:SAM-dependent methyltransferase